MATVKELSESPADFHVAYEPKIPEEIFTKLRKAGRRVKKLLVAQRMSNLEAYFEVGKLVQRELEEIATQHGNVYGRQVIHHLSEAAEIDSSTLRNCLRIVTEWGEAEFAAIIACKGLFWAHVCHLLSVPTAAERAEFASRVAEEGWTGNDLAKAIMAKYGNRRENSGRKPAIPKSVPQAVGRLLSMTKKSNNMLSVALFGEDYDLVCELDELPPDRVTPELRQQVVSAVSAMKELSAALAEAAPRLEEALPHLDHAIAATAEAAERPVQEEDPYVRD